MRLEVLKQLVVLNYATSLKYNAENPTTQERAQKIHRSLLRQTGLIMVGSLVYCILFGIALVFSPTEQIEAVMEGLYSMMTMLLMLSAFNTIFSVFYESNDLQAYRSYPFTEVEILLSKGISVLMTLMTYLLPNFILQVIAFIRFSYPWWMAIIASLPLTVLLIVMYGLLSFILVSLLAKTRWFGRYQKMMAALLMILNFFSVYLSAQLIQLLTTSGFTLNIPIYRVFYLAVAAPLSHEFLIHLFIWLVVLMILSTIVKFKVIPTFYEEALQTTIVVAPSKKKVPQASDSLTKSLWRYNLGLIRNSSSIMYLNIFTALFPLIMIGKPIFQAIKESSMPSSTLLAFSLLGMGYACLTTNASSLSAVIISLDGANYDYLKSLPFKMGEYFKVKLQVSYVLQSIIPVVIIIGIQVWGSASFLSILCSIISYYLAAFPLSMFFLCKDYQTLNTQWKDVSELVTRKKKGWGCVTALLYVLVVFISLASIYASTEITFKLALLLVFLSWLVFIVISMLYYHFRFRHLLDGTIK